MSAKDYAESRDAELVARVRAGDKNAYGELVASYQGHVYGLAYSIVGNWANAQDIAQEVFIRAYCNLDQLREPARFAAWLRRVTFSVTMNWLKAFRPKLFEQLDGRVDLDALDVPDFAPDPRQLLEKRELADAVLSAVDSLPAKYRVPLTMFHLDGLSYEKVARFLDIPLGTAKSLIHRARAKLREALAAYVTEEVFPMVQEVLSEHKLPEAFARKVLDGVPALGFGRGKNCTFPGALEAALKITEHPYSYAHLMGVSALSFRVRWHEGWCPSCTVGEMDEEIAAVAKATGSQFRVKTGKGGADMERFLADIVTDVDAGRPVLVYSPELNVSVAYGYEDAGKTLLLRDYMKGDRETALPARELGFLLIFLGEHLDPLSPRDAFVDALRLAVRNWRRGKSRDGKTPADYWYGEAALEQWRNDLEFRGHNSHCVPEIAKVCTPRDFGDTMGIVSPKSEDQRKKLFFLSWLNFDTVVDARKTAAPFLQEHLSLVNRAAADALKTAAALYTEEDAMFARVYAEKSPFFGPWTGKKYEDWTPEVRGQERDILSNIAKTERAAIAELDLALKAMG